jgi:hypothetical protein
VANFNESNKERVIKKYERLKGVVLQMRYGMQAPLGGAARGGDDALQVPT